jgi:hypothetical protein
MKQQNKAKQLTVKQIEKFASLAKKHTQKRAIVEMLKSGFTISVNEARLAGIADPCRVVYALRSEHGFPIESFQVQGRSGVSVTRYRLS